MMKELVTPQRRNGLLWGLALLLVVVAVVILVVRHMRESKPTPTAPPTPVVTATVVQQDVPVYLTGIGTVQAAQSVTVKARVDGQLEKVAFTEGQDVREGDLLAQIDPRSYQAQLEQAIAQNAHDEALLAAAIKDLGRYQTLVAQDSIQKQTLDTQQATVDQLRATVQSDQAQIDNAKVQLGYTTIRAPVRGRTGIRLIDAGNIVHAADTTGLVVINQIDPIAVIFTLPEDDLRSITQAMRVNPRVPLQVQALGRDDGALLDTGYLLLVNNQIDTSTGTFQLKAMFTNTSHALWPGQYVNARLLLNMQDNAITVPESVVQRGPTGLFAYVVGTDGVAQVHPIKVARTQGGSAIIADGLAAGTRVVVDGQYKIRPGSKVVEASKPGDKPADAIPAAPKGTQG